MSCARFAVLLEQAPLLQEEPPAELLLEPAEQEALRAHLAACAACRARAEELDQAYGLWAETREESMRPLSPELRERVLADRRRLREPHGAQAVGSPVREPASLAPGSKERAGFKTQVLPGATSGDGPDGGSPPPLPPPPLPRRRRHRRAWVAAGVGLALVGGVGLAFSQYLAQVQFQAQKQELRELTARGPLPEALVLGELLLEHEPDDPELAGLVAAIHSLLQAEERRARAADILNAAADGARPLDERLDAVERAIAEDPQQAAGYVGRAWLRPLIARRDALKAGPGHPEVAVHGALKDLEQASALEPDWAQVAYTRAKVLQESGHSLERRVQILRDLKRVEELAAGKALGWLARGLQQTLHQRPRQALEHIGRAIELEPTLVDAYLARARACLELRDLSGALQDANLAVELDPGSAAALTLRAEARQRANRDPEGARRDLDAALALEPARAEALALRAYVRLERRPNGEVSPDSPIAEAAREDAQRALRLDPTLALAHLVLVYTALDDRSRFKALRHADQAVKYAPGDLEALLCRGRVRVLQGDVDRAYEDFERILRVDPDNALALTLKAAMLIERREYERARALLDRTLQLAPGNSLARFYRGRLLLMTRPKDLRGAVEDFSEAINLDHGFAEAYFFRAAAHYDAQAFEDCLRDLERVESLQARGGRFRGRIVACDIWLIRGHAHYRREAWRQASEAYLNYVELAPESSPVTAKIRRRLSEIADRIQAERAASRERR